MNTLQFYLDETAERWGYESLDQCFKSCHEYEAYFNDLKGLIDEAATLYAEEACKEQRKICNRHAEAYIEVNHRDCESACIDEKSILNAPLAVNTEKV